MKSAVIVFPGSNCDRDMAEALRLVSGRAPAMVWHRESELPDGLDLIAIPGGFSYGDYLRSGAMAAQSPVMRAVERGGGARRAGARHLQRLPGADRGAAAARRADAQCRASASSAATSPLTVENSQSAFTARYEAGEEIVFPVAHHDGNYQADAETLDRLEGEGRVAFRYADDGQRLGARIAGILNEAGNVLGMMPHPERAVEAAHGRERRPAAVRRSAGGGRPARLIARVRRARRSIPRRPARCGCATCCR